MKKRKFKLRFVLYGLVIFYILYTLGSQQLIINRINNEIAINEAQNKKVKENNAYLGSQIEFAKTDEYKEKVARERIGLIKPGETVYVIENKN